MDAVGLYHGTCDLLEREIRRTMKTNSREAKPTRGKLTNYACISLSHTCLLIALYSTITIASFTFTTRSVSLSRPTFG